MLQQGEVRVMFTSLKHNPYHSTQVAQDARTAQDTAQENEIVVKYKAHCDVNGLEQPNKVALLDNCRFKKRKKEKKG